MKGLKENCHEELKLSLVLGSKTVHTFLVHCPTACAEAMFFVDGKAQ